MTIGWHFNNTYSKLSETFKENIKPVPVTSPDLVILNKTLASELDLDFSKIDKEELSKIFSGNLLPPGSNSIAQAYAGHQFGHFTMLGDVYKRQVNMVTGHGKDEETMCAEYKVSSVEVQKISNQFKTEVKPKENQAEVS